MASVVRISAAWLLMGLVAAMLVFGPPLLRIIALGPISLATAFVAS